MRILFCDSKPPWYIFFHLRDKDIKSDTQSCVFFTVASHVQGDTFAYAAPFLAPGNGAVAFEHSSFTWHALYSQNWRGAAALALTLYPHCLDQMLLVKGKFLSAGNHFWSGARNISHSRPVSSKIIVLPSIRRRRWNCCRQLGDELSQVFRRLRPGFFFKDFMSFLFCKCTKQEGKMGKEASSFFYLNRWSDGFNEGWN